MERDTSRSPPRASPRLLGPGRTPAVGRSPAAAPARPRAPRPKDAAVPRLDFRAATGGSATRRADPSSQNRADLLAGSGTDLGQKPPGPAHDRGHWPPDLASDPRADRPVSAGRPASGRLA